MSYGENKFGGMGNVLYLSVHMKIESRKKVAKLMKSYCDGKVFDYAQGFMRCRYRISSVIPVKGEYSLKLFKIKVEVIHTERKFVKRGEDGLRVRDAFGNYEYEFRRIYPDKKHAHNHNYYMRCEVLKNSVFKVFGLTSWDLEVGTVKWL